MKTYPKLLSIVAVLLFVCSSTVAQDWPRWFGSQMDGTWHETGMIDKFPESGADVLWRAPIGGGYGGPSVVGDRIFVMDRTEDEGKGKTVENAVRDAGEIPGGERVICFDAKTGNEIWSHKYDCPYKIAYPTGPRCSPAVDGDHVYTLGAMGDLICFTKEGEIVWQKNVAKEYNAKPPLWGFSSHPLVDGDMLLVPVGGNGSGVVAFNKMTGKEIWKAVTTIDVAYAPLVIYEANGERQLIFLHGNGITSLDPSSGFAYWDVKFPEEKNPSITAIATPKIVGNKILISEYYKGSLLLEVGSKPARVTEIWRSYRTDPRHKLGLNSMMTTPVVVDGFAYGIGYNGRGHGILRCLDLMTGEHKWTEEKWLGEKTQMFSSAFITKNEDKFFMMNDIGELVIAKLSPEGYTELDRAKLLEPTTPARGRKVVWSHPAYAGGKMYARNDNEIICVNLKK